MCGMVIFLNIFLFYSALCSITYFPQSTIAFNTGTKVLPNSVKEYSTFSGGFAKTVYLFLNMKLLPMLPI